ncbi:3-hydroxyacyl-CoA dehydrogenase family protein [Paenarthrobacter sp. RAF9]
MTISEANAGPASNAARKIAVVGSGYMGGGIAQVLALGGARVALADVSAEVAQKNYDRLLEESEQFIADGLFPAGSTEILKQNLWAAKDIEEAVADADFIEEAVPEVLDIKHQTLARISAAARPDALIGSNTSTISIADLAEAVTNPERFLGVQGIATADDVDTLVRTTFGFRLPFFGPFAIADMAGLDVYNFCYKSLQTGFPERFATPKILSDLVEAGKLGTKTGAGFLNVPAERTPELIAYRNKAYVAMQKLIEELGPAPIN